MKILLYENTNIFFNPLMRVIAARVSIYNLP